MEVWLVTIISSTAAIVVSLIGVILSNRKTNTLLSNLKEILLKDNNSLFNEHKGLSASHQELSADHKDIADKLISAKDKSSEQHGIITDNLKNLHHYIEIQAVQRNSLAGKELDVKNTVEHLSALVDLLAEQKQVINHLQTENQQLRELLQKSDSSKPYNSEHEADEDLEM